MAAYCALTDVEARLRGAALSASSQPTTTEATAIMADVYAHINAAIASHGVTVPITTPASFLAWLVAVNADGAAAQVGALRFANVQNTSNDDRGLALVEKRFAEAMARLWDGSALPAELAVSSAKLPTSYSVEFPDDPAVIGESIGAVAAGAFLEFEL